MRRPWGRSKRRCASIPIIQPTTHSIWDGLTRRQGRSRKRLLRTRERSTSTPIFLLSISSKLASLVFAGGAFTPPLTKGMLHAPLEPQYKVPRPKGGAQVSELADLYSDLGQEKEARTEAAEILRISPN